MCCKRFEARNICFNYNTTIILGFQDWDGCIDFCCYYLFIWPTAYLDFKGPHRDTRVPVQPNQVKTIETNPRRWQVGFFLTK